MVEITGGRSYILQGCGQTSEQLYDFEACSIWLGGVEIRISNVSRDKLIAVWHKLYTSSCILGTVCANYFIS